MSQLHTCIKAFVKIVVVLGGILAHTMTKMQTTSAMNADIR